LAWVWVLLAGGAWCLAQGEVPAQLAGAQAAETQPEDAPQAQNGAAAEDAPAPAPVDPTAQMFRQHVFALADPFMEGRAGGTAGKQRAAEYVEFYFRRAGLGPAFSSEVAGPGASMEAGEKSYRQRFVGPPSGRPGDSVVMEEQLFAYVGARGEVRLAPGTDVVALGMSADASVSGKLAFVGYSIGEGPEGYTSYPEGQGLAGRIAIVLRFEPMDEQGKSRWAEVRWSQHAGIDNKIRAAIKQGAAGVVIVNPPGASDPRAGEIDATLGLNAKALAVPVMMMSEAAADALVRAADAEGRSLLDLRRLADEEGGVIELPNVEARLATKVTRRELWVDNVGAVLEGAGELAGEVVVVGAHYDHVGYGYFGSRSGQKGRGVVHPGADDNASGTSALLLVAERLSRAWERLPDGQPRRTVLLLAFASEEAGLNGSKHYVNTPIAPLDEHALMINMDMVGRLREGKLEVDGVDTAKGMREWVGAALAKEDGLTPALKGSGMGPSDHASFASQGVPVLFFFTGLHEEYHRITDTPDLINAEDGARIARIVADLALDAATRIERFEFVSPTGRPGSRDPGAGQSMANVSVRFGISPGDYSGEVQGVQVGDAFPNLPAARAGLKSGDLIVRWNDRPVTSVESWMPMLSEHKPGDVVTIVYIRDGEEKTTQATLVAREQRGQ
jgi:Zn-dependent M28 family amino/carboxypeptidase